ncbi:hypothetical protein V3C99_019217 [Haemonchus contortus]
MSRNGARQPVCLMGRCRSMLRDGAFFNQNDLEDRRLPVAPTTPQWSAKSWETTVPATVIAKRTGIPRTSAQRILKKRGFKLVSKVRAYYVNEKQQKNRAECCQRLLPILSCCQVLFVEPGLKINAKYYVKQLREYILPSCSRLYRDGSFVLQQDWAPVHASRKTRLFGFSERRIS